MMNNDYEKMGRPIAIEMSKDGYPNVLGPESDVLEVPEVYPGGVDKDGLRLWTKQAIGEIARGGEEIDGLFDEQAIK